MRLLLKEMLFRLPSEALRGQMGEGEATHRISTCTHRGIAARCFLLPQRGELGHISLVFPSEKSEQFHGLAIVAKTAKHPTLEISWRTERPFYSCDTYGIVEALFRFCDAEHGFYAWVAVAE
jgi:hypothetical protein